MGVAMQRVLLLHDVLSLADKFASLSGNMLPGVFLSTMLSISYIGES